MVSASIEKQIAKHLLEEGIDLSYGKLSICDLRNYRHSHVRDDRRYQVHCDDAKCEFSGLYDEVEPAVEKFFDLKRRVRKIK